MGIIDYKGKPVMPTIDLSTFLNFDFSVYQKACFTDEGNDQVALESSVAANGSCGSGQTEVTKDNLKITSIRFMADWVEENTSGEFIVDGTLIEQAVTQAKNVQCKTECESAKSSCDSGCDSAYSSCTPSCYYTYYVNVNGVLVPHTGVSSSCMSACASARTSCKNTCESECNSCGGTGGDCDTNNDISGHTYQDWFPEAKDPASCN